MAHFLTLQSVDAILALIERFSPCPAEDVDLEEALGRTLAAPFAAPEDLPGFDRATMDGFAVRATDLFGASEGAPAFLNVVGEVGMGEKPLCVVGPGDCARIWTGGMMPEGADAVVMLEYAREAGPGQVELTRPVAPGDNIILRNQDAARGQELIGANRVLRPQEIGLLAAFGRTTLSVRRRPRVAVISSGDEVLPVFAVPGPGQVRDVNTHTLCALARLAGAEARSFGLVGDDRAKLDAILSQTVGWADVVLLSGGSSAGQRDFTVEALAAMKGCEILAHGVAISPGKPLIMARLGNMSLWGLPGHVAGALVCAEVFIRPLLARLLGRPGRPAPWAGRVRAALTRSVASAHGRRDYIRVALEPLPNAEGQLTARPIPGKSGLISTLVGADGMVVCPENREGLYQGEVLDVMLW